MQMDTRIAMMGVQPDFVGVMDSANQARARADEYAQANALRAYSQQYGQGIMAGEGNALAGLARIDPFAAQTAQANAQEFQNAQTRQSFLSSAEQRAVEEHAARMSAAERAAMREEGLQALGPYASARTAEEWYQTAKSLNQPEMANMFNERDRIFGQFREVESILGQFDATNAPVEMASPQSAIAKLQQDLTNGLITQSQYDFALQDMAPSGQTETIYGPDGKPILTRGPAGGGASLNVDEAKNVGFYERMAAAEPIIQALEAQGTDLGQSVASNIPLVGNYMVSDEYQQMQQAKADFIAALLRRESGAVISPSEFADADQRYFPQPGDSAAVIAQKRQARLTAIQGVATGAGGAPLSGMPQAAAAPAGGPAPQTGAFNPVTEAIAAPPAASGLPVVTNQAEFDALPPGTQFIDAADGSTWEKP